MLDSDLSSYALLGRMIVDLKKKLDLSEPEARSVEMGTLLWRTIDLAVEWAEGRVDYRPTRHSEPVRLELGHVATALISSCYEAIAAGAPVRQYAHVAQYALQLSQECIDAYLLLGDAAIEAWNLDEATHWYAQAVDWSEAQLDQQRLDYSWDEDAEWQAYLSALARLARAHWYSGDPATALRIYQRIETMDPADHLFVCWSIPCAAVESENEGLCQQILKEWPGGEAYWSYSLALLNYRESEDSEASAQALSLAMFQNPHVPSLLLSGDIGLRRMLVLTNLVGGQDEALHYAQMSIVSWQNTPGAFDWLRQKYEVFSTRHERAHRRNRRRCQLVDGIESLSLTPRISTILHDAIGLDPAGRETSDTPDARPFVSADREWMQFAEWAHAVVHDPGVRAALLALPGFGPKSLDILTQACIDQGYTPAPKSASTATNGIREA